MSRLETILDGMKKNLNTDEKVAKGQHRFEVLYGGGDLVASYDPEVVTQTEEAKIGFDALTALGYAAMVTAPPEREGQTTEFNPLDETVVFVPQICGGS